jgi:hypothetical protein
VAKPDVVGSAMGQTRTGFFGSRFIAVLSFCVSLSRFGNAARDGSAATHAPARAKPTRFTRASAWVIGLEGLLNLSYSRDSYGGYSGVDENGNTVNVKTTSSNLAFSTFAPKVALDAFVTDHVSVGVTAGFYEANSTSETTVGGQTNWQSQTTHTLDVTPRIGFGYVGAAGIGVWARGGVGMTSRWYDTAPVLQGVTSDSSTQSFNAHIDVLGVFMVRRDIVVGVGPWLTKYIAATGDVAPGSSKPGDVPPVFGLALGVGLVL